MVRFPHFWLRHSALFRCNFASDKNEKNSMEQKTALPENLCADEAVCFIADRHHVTPQQLLTATTLRRSSSYAVSSTERLPYLWRLTKLKF